ncbi:hypothetical protein PV08_03609 [Exophiala spinifera]|uniref:Uncharacterized protein n=1 Tax=Exophiala spinifera TaxID=91928 RepID=A0A0D2BL43_9EURO|nr:uncharacterized protein PV08_03609 [Exophiala spinifera]KIW19315.1 hypothetical protein PV08_03609 [Exophiala spinifera]
MPTGRELMSRNPLTPFHRHGNTSIQASSRGQVTTGEHEQDQGARLRQARVEIQQLEQAIKNMKCGDSLEEVSTVLMKSPEWTVTFQHATYTLSAVKIGRMLLQDAQAQLPAAAAAAAGRRQVQDHHVCTDDQYRAIVNETMARMRCGIKIEEALTQAKAEVEAGRI